MGAPRLQLSKSGLIAAWQCLRRIYLEKHHPELAVVSPQTQSLWATGHRVGEVAKRVYGDPGAVDFGFDRRLGLLVNRTRERLAARPRVPLFEATFRHENIVVRVDLLLPVADGWRAVEVKASTAVKDHHVIDCAIQDWVMRNAGVDLHSISLAHIDNSFVYGGDGDYAGLFAEHDLTAEARRLEPAVLELVAAAREAAAGPEPRIPVGSHCSKPYECPFIGHCWPEDSRYPVRRLGGAKAALGRYVAAGCRDIRDVDPDSITAETQRRIHRVSCSGVPEILAGAGRTFRALDYPRYYLDFETIAPAVPFWAGTRPYAALPVQWSCHIDDGSGDGTAATMRHEEFLDLSGKAPMRPLAEALVECLGDRGPVLMYTSYERQILERLTEFVPDLAGRLRAIMARLVDIHPVVKESYYHPDMLGSWSIKAVMPTIDAGMDYARLEGIREGTAAADGYLEAIDRSTSRERKAELELQLLRYCSFDTEAMAEIVRFFSAT